MKKYLLTDILYKNIYMHNINRVFNERRSMDHIGLATVNIQSYTIL